MPTRIKHGVWRDYLRVSRDYLRLFGRTTVEFSNGGVAAGGGALQQQPAVLS